MLFKPSSTVLVGLLWYGHHRPRDVVVRRGRAHARPSSVRRKSPWRMSKTRKMRARLRLKAVDDVIATLDSSGVTCAALVRPLPPPSPDFLLS